MVGLASANPTARGGVDQEPPLSGAAFAPNGSQRPRELALVADLREQNGQLVDGPKGVADCAVERFPNPFVMFSTDPIIPVINGGIPVGLGRLLGVIDLATGGSEPHGAASG
jgi:hypothetical protein